MNRAPSIRDVAQAAGVSTATVSRTLSAPEKVSELTRKAVFDAIEQTGYRVNIAARNLRKQEAGAIAVLVPNLANPFFSSILSGAAEVMSGAGYSVLINDTTALAKDDHRFPEYASKQHVDGLIVLDGLLDHQALLNRGPPATRPPIVYACEWSELDRPRVIIDNVAAARSAVEHLLALGHTRIGHISGPPGNVLTQARRSGVTLAMESAGLKMDREWLFPGDFSLEAGVRAGRAWVESDNRPTAVFCASDVMAIGFVGEVMRHGINVPGDVSVVGFDDLEIAAHILPSLTTVHQPRADIGRAAARLLLERMQLPPAARRDGPFPEIVMPTELVIRESTAPPRAASR